MASDLRKGRRTMLGDYGVEIEDSGLGQIVMSIPALRLIVMGRTLSEAKDLAWAALAFRWQADGGPGCCRPRPEADGAEMPPSQPDDRGDIPPLTGRNAEGQVYERLPDVEAQIRECQDLDGPVLLCRSQPTCEHDRMHEPEKLKPEVCRAARGCP